MKNKYIVINQNGVEIDPQIFLESNECPNEFRIVIEREALDISAPAKEERPKYLEIANKLGFNWEPNAGVGFMQFDYKAQFIMNMVKEYARSLVQKIGFPILEVSGSNFFDLSHPVVDAYANLFGDRLFKFKDENLVMSYDASYPQFNLAKKYQLFEKDLPFAHFSISDCYRYEQSGECMLLFRQRRFNMPDLHPYLKDVDEAFEWFPRIEAQIVSAGEEAGVEYFNVAKVSSEKNYAQYKDQLKALAIRRQKPVLVEIKMDREDRYWIVDVDYSFVDSFSQVREIGCIQIDVGNAQRLGIQYKSKSGEVKHPVIIHAAVPGGIERYIYMLLNNFPDSFPLWLYPVQLRLIPVSEKYVDSCIQLSKQYSDIRIDIDDNNDVVGKKVKRAHEDLIPYSFVIGKDEVEGLGNLQKLQELIALLQKEAVGIPHVNYSIQRLISRSIS